MSEFITITLAALGAIAFTLFFFLVAENRRLIFMPDRTRNPLPRTEQDDSDEDGGWEADWNDVEIDLPPGSGQYINPGDLSEAGEDKTTKPPAYAYVD